MPTYEYRCEEGHEFEVFQKMSDDPLTECPECGAAAERKISSGAGLVFKGSGFYITDYKKAEERKKEKSGRKGEAAAGSGDGSESSGEKPSAGSASPDTGASRSDGGSSGTAGSSTSE